MIDTLITQLAEKLGIEESMAKQAVGVGLSLLNKEGDNDLVSQLFSKIGGASDLAQEFTKTEQPSGGLGGLVGSLGGMLGGKAGDAMSALSALEDSGLSLDQAKDSLPVVSDFLKDQNATDIAKQVIDSIPAFKGLLG